MQHHPFYSNREGIGNSIVCARCPVSTVIPQLESQEEVINHG
jgi:hypothetical protein